MIVPDRQACAVQASPNARFVSSEMNITIDAKEPMSDKKPLALTDPEKLILIMLSEIQEHLKIKGEVDPAFIKEAIFSGNLWALGWELPSIFQNRVISEEVVTEVVDYLDMWQRVEESYEVLSAQNKMWLEKEAAPFGKPSFNGFDGNNEGEYISAARFLVERMDRFPRFKKRDLNSHYPSIATHRRMYAVFDPLLRSEILNNDMTPQQLATVLKARTHPDHLE